jgi:ABC-type Fe3+ transport system permease subunit
MTEACGISAMTAGAVAALATLAAPSLHDLVRGPSTLALRRAAWGLLLLPLLTPPIVVGYGYADASVQLVHAPLQQQALYALLLALRLTPAAVLVLAWSPRPGASPEALHCHRLLGRRLTLALWLRGPARARLAAAAVVALLAFSEFEIASLLSVRAWSVWLFDAHAGGLPLTAALRAAALPVAVQALIVAAAVAGLWPARRDEPQILGRPALTQTRPAAALASLWVAAALLLAVIVPAWSVLPGAWAGAAALWDDLTIAGELRHSALFAAAAALMAMALVRVGVRARGAWVALLGLPGLLGSLVVGLLVLALFQELPPLRPLYDTPVPLLVALVLLLLPVGLVLGALLSTLGRAEPMHAAALLALTCRPAPRHAAARLAHELVGRAWCGLAVVLFYLAYIDLPASALLSPSGMTPVVVRIYNLMHYGRIALLSAMVVLTLALPLVLLAAAAVGHRLWLHFKARGVSAPHSPAPGATWP